MACGTGLSGGRMGELAAEPLIQKYALGFQKVRTHDKQDAAFARTKVKGLVGRSLSSRSGRL